jgi:tRNA (guanine-N7-)-methyltransferase
MAVTKLIVNSSMTESTHPRSIRSFVVRGGRITEAQQRALEEYGPAFGVEYQPAPLDLDSVYGRQAPRVLEIGFGNGENLLTLAAAHPERDYLGVEVHRPGVGRLFLELAKAGVKNVRAICHDAVEVLENQIPAASLDEVLILFPDPWHKKRHHKRRLIQPPFVELIANRLKPQGVLHLATDWKPYAEHMMAVLSACSRFANVSPEGGYVPRNASRIPTRFERRGERLGHEVWDLAFRRL